MAAEGLTDADLVTRAEALWARMAEFGEEQTEPLIEKTPTGNDMAIDPMWIKAGSEILGGALGGSTSSSASSAVYTNLDNSGWTVATSGSDATGGLGLPWYVWVIGGVVAIKIFRKKKGG